LSKKTAGPCAGDELFISDWCQLMQRVWWQAGRTGVCLEGPRIKWSLLYSRFLEWFQK